MKRLFAFLTVVLFAACGFAQSPEKMSYQAVIRNSSGQLVTSQVVGMRISILLGSASGIEVYTETQTPTTNANGLVTIEIGGGTGFNTINWSAGSYYIKTETDIAGGTAYTITGTSKLLSVPYALHAKTAESITGTITETDPKYATDSSLIKTGVRNWNSSLAKNIKVADTTYWGRAETDPLYAADSTFIKTGVQNWNNSLAKTIGTTDTTRWGTNQSLSISNDSIFLSKGGYVKLPPETDPLYAADSSFIKTGVNSWNSSTAKTITGTDVTNWNNKSNFDGNYSSLTNAPDIALSTAAKTIPLATGGSFALYNGANTYLTVQQNTGLVGIGTNATVPRAQLEIGGTDGLLVRGTVNSGTIRALGAGLRLHWYPRKGAFRVGNAESSYWDDDGTSYPKMALYSIGMGYQPRATGVASTAIGAYNQATGDYSLALGSYSQATASHAVAIGTQAYATGIYSIAIGSGANTNGRDGSMVVGDDTYFQTAYSSADNQLTMRFSGGYRLWSSYPDSTAGVYMRHGQSGWSNYCDRNMKTNFEKLDYEVVLEKLGKVPVTKWNYKGIDDQKYIGPMAQDFYAAFQLGGVDSLGINSICEMGVNLAAIHGLIQRTDKLKTALDELQTEKEKVAQLETLLLKQSALIDEMRKELTELKNDVSNYAIKSKELTTKPLADNVKH